MAGNDSSNETLTKAGIQLSYNVTRLRRDPDYITLYVNWFLLLTTGIIPMGALIFLNSRIYAKILETRRLRERCRIRSSTVIALQARNADSTTTQGFIKQTLSRLVFRIHAAVGSLIGQYILLSMTTCHVFQNECLCYVLRLLIS